MAFEIVTLAPSIYHLQSGANMGVLADSDGRALLIDTGLDEDAGRRIKNALAKLNLTLAAVILTHGHSDHFGGTDYLRRNLAPFPVYAPPIEAAFITYSSLESIMLSAGALPFDQLVGKFTKAPACKVDHEVALGEVRLAGFGVEIIPLAGHSPNMIGVRAGNVLFCADALLPLATLQKYPIPFTVHIGKALAVLDRLLECVDQGVILAPGHGVHLAAGEAKVVIAANRETLLRIVTAVENRLREPPADEGTLTQTVCQKLGDPLASAVGYSLARTTIQAALVYLYESGRVRVITGGKCLWASAS